MELTDTDLESTRTHLRKILQQDSKIKAKLKKLEHMVANLPEMVSQPCEEVLAMKNQLLLSYLTSVTEVMARKLSRSPIEGLPALEMATENRVVFEQLRKHDKVLKRYMEQQMESLKEKSLKDTPDSRLNIVELVSLNDKPTSKKRKKKDIDEDDLEDEDEDRFVPFASDVSKKMAEQDDMLSEEDDQSNDDDKDKEDDDGLFKPIKVNPTTFNEGLKNLSLKDQQKAAKAQKRVLQSSVLLELQREHSDAPTEIKEGRDLFRHRENVTATQRQNYEEDTFTRIRVSKKDMTKARRLATVNTAHQVANFDGFTPFDDANPDGLGGSGEPMKKKKKLSVKGKKKKGGKKSFKRKKH